MTKIALISDIHANLAALEAILADIDRQAPDRILSLGDQINLGPCPQETLQLLQTHHVKCLDGNHERYVREYMDGLPGYDGANFDTIRFTAARVTREQLCLPEAEQIGSLCFCHALPGEDTFPVYHPERAISRLHQRHYDGIRHVICGHGHNPTQIRTEHLQIDSIGSGGCMDSGAPGTALYAMLWLDGETAVIRPRFIRFDVMRVFRLFLETGLADYTPIMARIMCQQMSENQSELVPFVTMASRIAEARGEPFITPDTLTVTDGQFDWADGKNSAQYWSHIRSLLRHT